MESLRAQSALLRTKTADRADLLSVGIGRLPYLADHGFHDMAILPGAFYIDEALSLHRERFKCGPSLVRNISFPHPIVLSADDTVLQVAVKELSGSVEYVFHETGVENDTTKFPMGPYAARLEIGRSPSASRAADNPPSSRESLQAEAHAVTNGDQFYKRLRANGNQYGPSFQTVSTMWHLRDGTLGKFSTRLPGTNASAHIHLMLLDSVTQLLASFVIEQGKTFVLQSIESIAIGDTTFPEQLWGHAVVHAMNPTSCIGSIRVFDGAGKVYMELTGVALTLLDHVRGTGERTATLAIASNFTAEPVEDSLRFWSDDFGVPARLEFAPYNQIFQQLLDRGSAFYRNRSGINVIMLSLEEWAVGDRRALLRLDRQKADRCFAGRVRYVLPNGLEIVHLNQYETDHIYQEIFKDRTYLRHGIRLQDDATVLDIGANIGLFSLFVMSHCGDAKIYAYEPAPPAYELVRANCEAYGSQVTAVNAGVSDTSASATFTFYEKSSVFSGFYPDDAEDGAAVRAVVRNTLRHRTSADAESLDDYVGDLTRDRLDRTMYECRMTTVSQIIREHHIDMIDLLKIDAEKSELKILQGIEDADWRKIDQIVIEIHDRTPTAVTQIKELLARKGYRCCAEHDALLADSGLITLYATQAGAPSNERSERTSDELGRNVRDFCAALRSFMSDSTAPLLLCLCPTSPAAAPQLAAALNDAERTILTEARAIPNVHTISSPSLLDRYPVSDYYDPHGHQAGHILYTAPCYAAIGTTLVRTIVSLTNPFKVIVLDCDNTLWKGICGEDGPLGVAVTEPFRSLQQFMVGQMNAGMLLSLCSKNDEQDVLDVFQQRSDMILKLEHLAARRINWNSKAANVRSLVRELNVGLDSVIFIDDDPIECADVRINCPGVLALQLPRAVELLPSFLTHTWAFDRSPHATSEDRGRTQMYRENAAREQFRQQTLSLNEFIQGLQLRVDITEPTAADIARISQLTFRTNQFNFTTIRRSEREIADFLQRRDTACLVVRAADRFGDYGLVGVVMYEIRDDRYAVDTLLLSCRVLGRGVEHAVVSRLGRLAVDEGKAVVELPYRPTSKNLPVLAFMNGIGARYRNEDGTSWIIPADRLAAVEYGSEEHHAPASGKTAPPASEAPGGRPPSGFALTDHLERLQQIADHMCDVGWLMTAIETHRLRDQPPDGATGGGASSTLQATLLAIWRNVLGKSRISVNDNFFEAGGTSLKAVQVTAAIKRELKRALSIVTLFECPTVALLAARLDKAVGDPHESTTVSTAALRGQQRRYRSLRPRAS